MKVAVPPHWTTDPEVQRAKKDLHAVWAAPNNFNSEVSQLFNLARIVRDFKRDEKPWRYFDR